MRGASSCRLSGGAALVVFTCGTGFPTISTFSAMEKRGRPDGQSRRWTPVLSENQIAFGSRCSTMIEVQKAAQPGAILDRAVIVIRVG